MQELAIKHGNKSQSGLTILHGIPRKYIIAISSLTLSVPMRIGPTMQVIKLHTYVHYSAGADEFAIVLE